MNGGGSVAVQEEAPPETLTVKQMDCGGRARGIGKQRERAVAAKTAAGMDTGSSLSEQFEAQGGALELQIKQYQEMIGKMEEAMEQIADKESDLYKTYEAQKKLLENQRGQPAAKRGQPAGSGRGGGHADRGCGIPAQEAGG